MIPTAPLRRAGLEGHMTGSRLLPIFFLIGNSICLLTYNDSLKLQFYWFMFFGIAGGQSTAAVTALYSRLMFLCPLCSCPAKSFTLLYCLEWLGLCNWYLKGSNPFLSVRDMKTIKLA